MHVENAFLAGAAATLVLGAAACSSDQPPAAVYATNWASNTIAEFPTNPDGSLRGPAISISAGPGPTHPQGSVRSHDGTWLYVSNWGTAGITPFRIGPDGTLTASPTVPGPAPAPVTPSGIALSPDGGHIYTANFGNATGPGSVTSYPIAPDGTVGTGRPPVPTGGRQPDLGSITVSGR